MGKCSPSLHEIRKLSAWNWWLFLGRGWKVLRTAECSMNISFPQKGFGGQRAIIHDLKGTRGSAYIPGEVSALKRPRKRAWHWRRVSGLSSAEVEGPHTASLLWMKINSATQCCEASTWLAARVLHRRKSKRLPPSSNSLGFIAKLHDAVIHCMCGKREGGLGTKRKRVGGCGAFLCPVRIQPAETLPRGSQQRQIPNSSC